MYKNLNAELTRNDIKQEDIATCLGLDASTISLKMNGKSEWKLSECKTIIKKLLPNYSIDYLFRLEEDDENK